MISRAERVVATSALAVGGLMAFPLIVMMEDEGKKRGNWNIVCG